MKRLKLVFNPYTYTRVAVMRTLLLRKEDYDRIMKLSFSEIASYLDKTTYRKQIEELGLKFSGAELLEHALNRNMLETYEKLKRISDPDLRQVIEAYVLREDFHNLKVILRSKFVEASVENLLLPIGLLKKHQLEKMIKAEKIQDVLKISGLVDMKQFREEKFDLADLENRLDKVYFSMILEFADMLGGEIFAEFLKNEIDAVNILNLFRLKMLNRDPNEIKKLLIYSGNILNEKKLKRLAEVKSVEDMIPRLRGTRYYRVVKEFDQNKRMFFKTMLYRQLLKESVTLLHKNVLSVDVILAFALSKEIEVKNLKMIIKGKQLGVPNEVIEQQLVY